MIELLRTAADVESIIIRQATRLDWECIIHQLTPLADAKEQPEIIDRLIRRRAEFEK